MKPHLRAVVSATAVAHSTGKNVSSIYDYSSSQHATISVSMSGSNVNGYDYARGSTFSGSLSNLYDYGDGHTITLKEDGPGEYSGYDYGSSHHFMLTISGGSVSLYDYETGTYYNFLV